MDPTFTDDDMRDALSRSRLFTVVFMRHGPRYEAEDAQATIWEHGRRNFELRAGGTLAIVGPLQDDSEIAGPLLAPHRCVCMAFDSLHGL